MVGTAEGTWVGRQIRNSRTANRTQIDIQIFELDADRVIEQVLGASIKPFG